MSTRVSTPTTSYGIRPDPNALTVTGLPMGSSYLNRARRTSSPMTHTFAASVWSTSDNARPCATERWIVLKNAGSVPTTLAEYAAGP